MYYVALILLFLVFGLIVLHGAVLFGAPLNSVMRGGVSEGKLSTGLRVLSGFEILFLMVSGFILAIKAEMIFYDLLDDASVYIWGISGYFALNVIINMVSRNHLERAIIAPVYILLFTGSLLLSLS